MKRSFFIMLGVLLINTLAVAQMAFNQRGRATHEMRGDGLTAAHPSLPLGLKIMVVNISTGKELEVTITGRIPGSSNRIVDLSRDAWRELGLTEKSTEVRLYSLPQPPVAVARPPDTQPRFSQYGKASQEMEDGGLVAAHPGLMLGSKVKITNTANGKTIEVTIVRHISVSVERVIDISFDTAIALEWILENELRITQ